MKKEAEGWHEPWSMARFCFLPSLAARAHAQAVALNLKFSELLHCFFSRPCSSGILSLAVTTLSWIYLQYLLWDAKAPQFLFGRIKALRVQGQLWKFSCWRLLGFSLVDVQGLLKRYLLCFHLFFCPLEHSFNQKRKKSKPTREVLSIKSENIHFFSLNAGLFKSDEKTLDWEWLHPLKWDCFPKIKANKAVYPSEHWANHAVHWFIWGCWGSLLSQNDSQILKEESFSWFARAGLAQDLRGCLW